MSLCDVAVDDRVERTSERFVAELLPSNGAEGVTMLPYSAELRRHAPGAVL